MSRRLVRSERNGPVAVVTLDRPEALNALSRALRAELAHALSHCAEAEDVRAIVLTGAGRAFCAGLDLKELAADGLRSAGGDDHDPVKALLACRQPVIAAVNGAAITGGFELALACDVLLASTEARFADTHARVGILPGWGLSQRLSRVVGPYRAKELSLTGNFLDARTALDWGLVNRVTAPDELLAAAIALAHDMAQIPPATVAAYKEIIDEGYAASFGDALELEKTRSGAHNRSVTAAEVAERRADVQARGRAQ